MALDVICAKKYSLPLIIKNLRWHKTCNKDVGIVTLDLIGLLSTNHIFILRWHSRVNEEMFDVNIKIAETTQHKWVFFVGNSSPLNKWLTLAIILEISYSADLETRKYGPNLEFPRLPGRVNSTAHNYYQKHSPNSLHCNKWDKLTGKISAQLHRFIMHAAIYVILFHTNRHYAE